MTMTGGDGSGECTRASASLGPRGILAASRPINVTIARAEARSAALVALCERPALKMRHIAKVAIGLDFCGRPDNVVDERA